MLADTTKWYPHIYMQWETRHGSVIRDYVQYWSQPLSALVTVACMHFLPRAWNSDSIYRQSIKRSLTRPHSVKGPLSKTNYETHICNQEQVIHDFCWGHQSSNCEVPKLAFECPHHHREHCWAPPGQLHVEIPPPVVQVHWGGCVCVMVRLDARKTAPVGITHGEDIEHVVLPYKLLR